MTWPKSLLCVECEGKITGEDNAYLLTCCGYRLVCNRCNTIFRGKVYCNECGVKPSLAEICQKFFGSIEKELYKSKVSQEGTSKREENRQFGNDQRSGATVQGESNWSNKEKEDVFHMIYEEAILERGTAPAERAAEVYTSLREYRHANQCKLYHNIQYLCEVEYKLKEKQEQIQISKLLYMTYWLSNVWCVGTDL